MNDIEAITIDIKNIDRSIGSKGENRKLKESIQRDALDKITKILKSDLKNEINNSDDIYKVRVHNAIFINGARGSGKTELLVSIEQYLQNQKPKLKSGLHFFHPIDPTLLYENEHFLTIIIARILNDIDAKDLLSMDTHRTDLYEGLSNIAIAIDGVTKNSSHHKTSLEHMSQEQTSLKLEVYMHSFFKKIAHILGKNRLVLLIDDVDMAFERGFDVLEVVRKYLSSPYIIPIITGDLGLYKTIVKNHFIVKIDNSLKEQYLNEHPRLVEDYLSKVLPLHRRAKIKSLYELSNKKNIEFVYGKDKYFIKCSSCKQGDNGKYFREIAKGIFESEEFANRFAENLFSNPLRNVIQFLHSQLSSGGKDFSSLTTHALGVLEEEYRLVLLKNIDTEKIRIDSAKTDYRYGHYKQAIERAKSANKIKETAEAYFIMAKSYFRDMDYISAKESYMKTIELDKDFDRAYYELGYMYRNGYLGEEEFRYDKAIEYLQKSIEINPTYDAYNSLGTAYLSKEDYQPALENFKKAIDKEKNRSTAYLNIIESSFIDDDIHRQQCTEEFKNHFIDRFGGDTKAMLVYDMTLVLKRIKDGLQGEELQEVYQKWDEKYPQKVYLGEWSFNLTTKYIESIKNNKVRERLSEYLEKFRSKIK